jgi:hypothetical protein
MDEGNQIDNLGTVDEHALIDWAVCSALGRSRAELMAIPLMAFFELAANAGYDVTVTSKQSKADKGRLTVTMAADAALTPPPSGEM